VDAATAAEALDLTKNGARFDLVITDAIMPHVNGHDFAAYLRQTQPQHEVSVYFWMPD